MTLALDDVRVLDLSRLLPGPYCSLLLADLGADVIKVEDTSGGDRSRWPPLTTGVNSAIFHTLNRNKRSIALDLKHERGREVFLKLAETCDVVIDGFRPGVMDRLGIGYPTLRQRNLGIVLCSLTGYGQDGPYRERAGHDLNYIAATGVLSMTGSADGELAIPGVQIGDIGAGGMSAVIAILTALHERRRSGEGQHCDVAMMDGLISWLSIHAARYFAEGVSPGPAGHALNGCHPCYRVYACAGGHLSVAALEPKFWQAFVAAIGLPHLGAEGFAAGAEADRVAAEVAAVLVQRTAAEWMSQLGDQDVCVEPVLDIGAALDHPQARHRQMTIPAGEGGPLPQTGFPFKMSRTSPAVRRVAPDYAEHTAEVLAGIGVDAGAYSDLREAGVVR